MPAIYVPCEAPATGGRLCRVGVEYMIGQEPSLEPRIYLKNFANVMNESMTYKSLSRLVVDVRRLENVRDGFSFVGEFGPESDALGFRLQSCPRFLFSFSTHAGRLPYDIFDMQVSIVDDTLENGEICFLGDVHLADAVANIKSYIEGRRS